MFFLQEATMRKLLTGGSVLAAALVFGACQDATEPVALEGSGGSGNDTQCVGVLVGTFDNVVVPRGATCNLQNSTVRGNVKALEDSRLFMLNDLVRGNVEGDKASSVQVTLSLVEGNIRITEGHDPVFLSAVVQLSDLPNGNIQIEKGRFPLGDWDIFLNTLDKGNIRTEENSSIFTGFTTDNTVAQDVQVFKNTQGLIAVAFNFVGENLQCKENSEPFIAVGNVVGGNAEDQCAGAEMAGTVSTSARASLAEFPVRKQGK
jgi:hypothetical protein